MIDGSEKRNRQLAFELQNSHVCEKRSNAFATKLRDNIGFARHVGISLMGNNMVSSAKIYKLGKLFLRISCI